MGGWARGPTQEIAVAKKTPQKHKAAPAKPAKHGKPASKPVAAKTGTAKGAKPAAKPAKIAAKASAKPAAKAPEKKLAGKAVAAAKPAPKGNAKLPATAAKAAISAKNTPAVVDDKKGNRKGITVVDPKAAAKKAKPKDKPVSIAPPGVGRLLDPKNPVRRPLIASGPKAAQIRPLGMQGPEEDRPVVSGKSPFGKKDLAHFRQVLIRKRSELVGDVSQMENEALQGNSGATSVPQHMAEQGSDTYDQSLALDIAAADRKLIKEIDDAIKRIDLGTYGVCELTGKPIKRERLEELPWARYSIEAARELERRSMWA